MVRSAYDSGAPYRASPETQRRGSASQEMRRKNPAFRSVVICGAALLSAVAEPMRNRGTDQEANVFCALGYRGGMMIHFLQQHDDTPSIYLVLPTTN